MVTLEDVFDEVMERRAQWAAEHGDRIAHFASTLRGGAWTAAHTGAAVDSLRCYAATPVSKEWCRTHGLAQSCTLSLRMYGDEVAAQLGDDGLPEVQAAGHAAGQRTGAAPRAVAA